MHLLHRSGKRLLSKKSYSILFTGLTELPLHAFHHSCQLEGEPAQKNIINEITRRFSALVEDQIHESCPRNQNQGCLSVNVYSDVCLSKHMHMPVYQKRKCNHDALELAGGATSSKSVTPVDDCAFMHVDDCALASQKTYKRRSDLVVDEVGTASQKKHKEENCTNEDVLELVIAEAQTISHRDNKKQTDSDTSELSEADFLTEEKKNNRSDYGTLELACKDMKKKKRFVSSMPEHAFLADETTKYLSKAKQGQTVYDNTESFVSDAKVFLQRNTGEHMKKEGSKRSADNTETCLQREDKEMLMVKDTSNLCLYDTRTSSDKKMEGGKRSDHRGFLEGGAAEKSELSMKTQDPVSWPSERMYLAVQKKKKKNKKKKKKNCWDPNRQFEHEDLKHLNLTTHPFCIAAADRRQVSQGITDKKKQKLFACEANKPKFDEDIKCKPGEVSKHIASIEQSEEQKEKVIKNTSWEEELIKTQDRKQMIGELWRGPSRWKKAAHRPLLLAENLQARSNALSENHSAVNEVIDKVSTSPTHSIEKWQRSHTQLEPQMSNGLRTTDAVEKEAVNEAAASSLRNRGKMIVYNHLKAGTSLDYSSKDCRTAQVETNERGVDGDQWDNAGAPKARYPLRNYRELYIILDLNGVLIKRWDKNPSLPGVSKLNRKWIQLRPGCIEFLDRAFSIFRVGIWSTMTQKNVLSVCKLLEQQAHQSLPFFMLWSKDSCYQLGGVQRPDKSHVIADFKPLSHVWDYFKPYLGFHNTVLVDDSPYKACMNNPFNCIFPDAFEGHTEDKYLNDVLWPYLERMRVSQNIQGFIANNPFGQPPIVVGHELYHHVRQVIDVFDHFIKPIKRG